MKFRLLVFIALTLIALSINAAFSGQNAEIPSTDAGRLISLMMKALNSGSEDKWNEFIDKHWIKAPDEDTRDRRLNFFRIVYNDTKGIQLHSIESADENSITVLVKPDKGTRFEWLNLTVMVAEEDKDKVGGASMRPGTDPQFRVPDKKFSKSEMIEFLDKYIDDLVAEDRFSGAVLIARDGKPFYKRVEGVSSKRYQIPNRLDTKFNLGSMNKMFTGTAIMQLVEQGKIDLNDKVGKYLPDIPRKEIAEKVTIHHLLSHTSGMQDYWDEMFDTTFWELKTVEQLSSLIFDDTLLFEPGSDFHYSNSGPIVLGLIIEKVTGQDYYDYIRGNIYEPAGMENSGCFPVDRPIPNLAIGYTKMDYNGRVLPEGVWHNNLFMHAAKGGPAGGGYSTVEDLLAFDQALRKGKLLNKESFELMTTGKTDREPGVKYAYLFMDKDVNGQRIIGHGGGAPGINAMLEMYLDSGYTVAVMSNYDRGASPIAEKARELLTRK
ncbi:MAG: serine hydrolase [candidate division Zixibacteria bacterium]|nr:serine hydrolase [candidate division Zixibacteria bacterium]